MSQKRKSKFSYIALNMQNSFLHDVLSSRDWEAKSEELLALGNNRQEQDPYTVTHPYLKVDLIWLNNINFYLNDKSNMDKFLIANRLKNISDLTQDLLHLKNIFFKVQDIFNLKDSSNYNQLQKQTSPSPQNTSQFIWVLKKINKQNSQQQQNEASSPHSLSVNKEQKPIILVINPQQVSDLTRVYDYLPCNIHRYLANPLIFNKAIFKSGNHQVGFKTKYRFNYKKFLDILSMRGTYNISNYNLNGVQKDEIYDKIWNRLCQKIILTVIMLLKSFQYVQDRTFQLLNFKFEFDSNLKPYLVNIKQDFSFKLKDNIFDEIKVNMLNECMKIVESKVKEVRRFVQKYPLMINQEEIVNGKSKARLTLQQLENVKIYKRQQIKVKDALQLARLEEVPQAFYLYKQRNDLLINRLKNKDNEKLIFKDKLKLENRTVLQMSENQKEKIRKNLAKTKNHLQFHVNQQFQDQLVEDIERILNNSTSDQFQEDLFLLKKIDYNLLKEGFRVMYLINHREDIQHLIRSYKSFQIITKYQDSETASMGSANRNDNQWIQKQFMSILADEGNPKVFMNMIKEKLSEVEKSQSQPALQVTINKESFVVNSHRAQQIILNSARQQINYSHQLNQGEQTPLFNQYQGEGEPTPSFSRSPINQNINDLSHFQQNNQDNQSSRFKKQRYSVSNNTGQFQENKFEVGDVINKFFKHDKKASSKHLRQQQYLQMLNRPHDDNQSLDMSMQSSYKKTLNFNASSSSSLESVSKNQINSRKQSFCMGNKKYLDFRMKKEKQEKQIAKFEKKIQKDEDRLNSLENMLKYPITSRTNNNLQQNKDITLSQSPDITRSQEIINPLNIDGNLNNKLPNKQSLNIFNNQQQSPTSLISQQYQQMLEGLKDTSRKHKRNQKSMNNLGQTSRTQIIPSSILKSRFLNASQQSQHQRQYDEQLSSSLQQSQGNISSIQNSFAQNSSKVKIQTNKTVSALFLRNQQPNSLTQRVMPLKTKFKSPSIIDRTKNTSRLNNQSNNLNINQSLQLPNIQSKAYTLHTPIKESNQSLIQEDLSFNYMAEQVLRYKKSEINQPSNYNEQYLDSKDQTIYLEDQLSLINYKQKSLIHQINQTSNPDEQLITESTPQYFKEDFTFHKQKKTRNTNLNNSNKQQSQNNQTADNMNVMQSPKRKLSPVNYKFSLLFPFNELTRKDISDELATLNEKDYFTLAMIVKKTCGYFKYHNFQR
eukprot:403356024